MSTEKSTKTNYNIIIIWVAIISIAVLFITTIPVIAQYKTGSLAPDFTLEALDGKVFQLNQFLNKQQHLILFFMHSEQDSSIAKFEEIVTFISDFQPRESYQIVAIIEQCQGIETIMGRLNDLKEKTELPLIFLLDAEGKVSADYGIKNYPTILLLRVDLYVRKAYDRFTTRQEASFYQYLRFIFTSQKSKDSSGGCDDGVCPPPPGFE
jgi:peroxiredoxin